MNVLRTDISGLFFSLAKCTQMDVKAQMCTHMDTQHTHTLHLGAESIDGSHGGLVDASGSVQLTLHTHNFK